MANISFSLYRSGNSIDSISAQSLIHNNNKSITFCPCENITDSKIKKQHIIFFLSIKTFYIFLYIVLGEIAQIIMFEFFQYSNTPLPKTNISHANSNWVKDTDLIWLCLLFNSFPDAYFAHNVGACVAFPFILHDVIFRLNITFGKKNVNTIYFHRQNIFTF